MLIIMCGYPSSGKSTFLDLLSPYLGDHHIIRPSDWYPDDIDNIDSQDRTKYQLACWEHALDKTILLLSSKPVDIPIILDTCAASPNSLNSIIETAKLHRHKIIAIVIGTPASICASRANPDVIQRYINKIPNAVRTYREKFHKIIPIKYGDLEAWKAVAKRAAEKLWQDKHASQTQNGGMKRGMGR